MDEIELTPEQEQEAERIEDIVIGTMKVEARRIARLLASKNNRELLGETEFHVREAMHRLGARTFDAALSERKKRGTKTEAPASSVLNAAPTRGLSDTGAAP
jgi:hypothetical protein